MAGMAMYDTLMPLVKQQVRSQLKVCDMTRASVGIDPADHASWSAAAEALIAERMAPINARRNAELGTLDDRNGTDGERIRQKYKDLALDIESDLMHKPMEFFCELQTQYNFL
jgi:hypothetical protein